MKQFVWAVLVAIAACTVAFHQPVLAADTSTGAKVFSSNCAACHAGGMNVISGAKTLKKDALKQYGMDSPEAIIQQVTNGNGVMPAFKGKLTGEQIEAVAAYVLDQADKDWHK